MIELTAYIDVDSVDGSSPLASDVVRSVKELLEQRLDSFSYYDASLGRHINLTATVSVETNCEEC